MNAGPFAATTENDLICYQCQSHSLEECRKPKYLKPCPNDQAYNRCETTIKKKGEFFLTRKEE